MPRKARSQSKHDLVVKQEARNLKNKGFTVKADIPGFSRPDTIGGYRPDVYAEKGKIRKIIEVETPDSVDSARDQKQQKTFKAVAKRSKNTTFKRKITK